MIRMVPMFSYSDSDSKTSDKFAKEMVRLRVADSKTLDRISQINEEIISTTEAFQKARMTGNSDEAWSLNVKLQKLNGEKQNLQQARIREHDRIQQQLFQLTNPAIEALTQVLLGELKRVSALKVFEIDPEIKFDESKDPPVRIYILHHNFDQIRKTVAFIMEGITKIRGMAQSSLSDLDQVYRQTMEKIPLDFPLSDLTKARPSDLQDFRDELNEQTPKQFSVQRRYISFLIIHHRLKLYRKALKIKLTKEEI